MQEKERNKIEKFRYPVTFVTVVFAFILIYLIVEGILVFSRKSLQAFNIGTPVSDNPGAVYSGILLRDEVVYYAESDGFVHFYGVETDLKKKEDVIYTVDASGELNNLLHDWSFGQETLSSASLRKIRQILKNGMVSFDLSSYSAIHTAKADIQSAVLQALLSDSNGELLHIFSQYHLTIAKADRSGFLLQWQDGLEGKAPEDLTAADFSEDRQTIRSQSGERLKSGDFVYKIANDNAFTLNFLLTEEARAALATKTTLTVVMEDGSEISGTFRIASTKDGRSLGVLSFSKYGANYLKGRRYTFRIQDKSVTGYKIPESAIVTKNYFVVGKEFLTIDQVSGKGLMVVRKNAPKLEVDFVACSVLEKSRNTDSIVTSDDVVYVIASALKPGDVILGNVWNPATNSYDNVTTTLGRQIAVEGVYQINNGYCIFKPILRLVSSMESSYVMISSRVRGGLVSYDRIVLNAHEVKENEIVVE